MIDRPYTKHADILLEGIWEDEVTPDDLASRALSAAQASSYAFRVASEGTTATSSLTDADVAEFMETETGKWAKSFIGIVRVGESLVHVSHALGEMARSLQQVNLEQSEIVYRLEADIELLEREAMVLGEDPSEKIEALIAEARSRITEIAERMPTPPYNGHAKNKPAVSLVSNFMAFGRIPGEADGVAAATPAVDAAAAAQDAFADSGVDSGADDGEIAETPTASGAAPLEDGFMALGRVPTTNGVTGDHAVYGTDGWDHAEPAVSVNGSRVHPDATVHPEVTSTDGFADIDPLPTEDLPEIEGGVVPVVTPMLVNGFMALGRVPTGNSVEGADPFSRPEPHITGPIPIAADTALMPIVSASSDVEATQEAPEVVRSEVANAADVDTGPYDTQEDSLDSGFMAFGRVPGGSTAWAPTVAGAVPIVPEPEPVQPEEVSVADAIHDLEQGHDIEQGPDEAPEEVDVPNTGDHSELSADEPLEAMNNGDAHDLQDIPNDTRDAVDPVPPAPADAVHAEDAERLFHGDSVNLDEAGDGPDEHPGAQDVDEDQDLDEDTVGERDAANVEADEAEVAEIDRDEDTVDADPPAESESEYVDDATEVGEVDEADADDEGEAAVAESDAEDGDDELLGDDAEAAEAAEDAEAVDDDAAADDDADDDMGEVAEVAEVDDVDGADTDDAEDAEAVADAEAADDGDVAVADDADAGAADIDAVDAAGTDVEALEAPVEEAEPAPKPAPAKVHSSGRVSAGLLRASLEAHRKAVDEAAANGTPAPAGGWRVPAAALADGEAVAAAKGTVEPGTGDGAEPSGAPSAPVYATGPQILGREEPPALAPAVQQARDVIASIVGSLRGGAYGPDSGLHWAGALLVGEADPIMVVTTSDAGWLPPGVVIPDGVRVLWNNPVGYRWASVDDPVRQIIDYANRNGHTIAGVATTHPSRAYSETIGAENLVGVTRPGPVLPGRSRLEVTVSPKRLQHIRALAPEDADRQARALMRDLEQQFIAPEHAIGIEAARLDARFHLDAQGEVPPPVLDQLHRDEQALGDVLSLERSPATPEDLTAAAPEADKLRDRLLERAILVATLAGAHHDIESAVYAWTFARFMSSQYDPETAQKQ